MRRLMEQTSATILLGILDGATITIVDKDEPLTDVRVAASIGMRLPFCAGAFGKVFMAFMPDEVVDQLLDSPGLVAFTPASITDVDQYRVALDTVREQGYAIDDREEYLLDVGAISAPIFAPAPASNESGDRRDGREVAAVITLVNFSSRLSPEITAEFIPYVVEAGREISQKLGVSLK